MSLVDVLIIWLHLICASIWVGGSIFLGIVLAPMLNMIAKKGEERMALMIGIGRRFNKIAMPSFGILIITGIYNSRAFFTDPSALVGSSYGIILLIKIILVCITLITYIIHIKILSTKVQNRLETGNIGSTYIQSMRSKIICIGRITVIMSIAILLLAALLHNGGSVS